MNDAEGESRERADTDHLPKVKTFDLEERTAVFGETLICFLKKLKPTSITVPLIKQVVRSATSIGANYCEADAACSRPDFKYRIGICQREAKETKYWLRMIVAAAPESRTEARLLWREAHELYLIFSSIRRKTVSDKKVDA